MHLDPDDPDDAGRVVDEDGKEAARVGWRHDGKHEHLPQVTYRFFVCRPCRHKATSSTPLVIDHP
jgi:hypothetical protein